MRTDIFKGRKLLVATKHEKERVIAPALKSLGVEVVVPRDFDTDRFGTFSGEIERNTDPVEAARKKCLLACKQYNCTLAVASEGSFGPHPGMFFVPADDEILVLVDLENNIEIKSRELSTKTNFSGKTVYSWSEAKAFAEAALFPEHGLIVKQDRGDTVRMIKGIRTWKALEIWVKDYLGTYGHAFLETDMRAMHNPTRMNVISQAANKLLRTARSLCPKCSAPGFDVAHVVEGLPCGTCMAPTKSTLALVYKCQKCRHTEEKKFPKGKTMEDAMYCDHCNP